eukprot:scaffold8982_cov125-Isochrysis_galbana.AAC.14
MVVARAAYAYSMHTAGACLCFSLRGWWRWRERGLARRAHSFGEMPQQLGAGRAPHSPPSLSPRHKHGGHKLTQGVPDGSIPLISLRILAYLIHYECGWHAQMRCSSASPGACGSPQCSV